MEIRALRGEDLDFVCELEKRCFPTPWSRRLFEQELAKPEVCRWLLALEDGEPLGYMGWWKVGEEAHVTNLAVVPEKRRCGVGKALVKAVLDQAKSQGCVRATLEVRPSNQAAVALYRFFGFEEAALRPGYYSDNGEDALLMWLASMTEDKT